MNTPQNTHVARASAARSSCPPNTVLVGMNYLKDQPPVLALPDEEYSSWLWKLLQVRVASVAG
jgi:large subunit ribosomal protein L54